MCRICIHIKILPHNRYLTKDEKLLEQATALKGQSDAYAESFMYAMRSENTSMKDINNAIKKAKE